VIVNHLIRLLHRADVHLCPSLSRQYRNTHVVAGFEHSLHIFVHVVVIQRHEERVDDDAECDEELYERIKDQQGHVLLKLEPGPTAIPHAKDVDTTEHSGQ